MMEDVRRYLGIGSAPSPNQVNSNAAPGQVGAAEEGAHDLTPGCVATSDTLPNIPRKAIRYDRRAKRILLFLAGQEFAHIGIVTHEATNSEPSSISLHTGTNMSTGGAEGGQGYMTEMFPYALIVVAGEFWMFDKITMAPAPGAATKGLVSQLSLLRIKILNKITKIENECPKAKEFLRTAQTLRTKRKKVKKASALGVNVWNTEIMKETMFELMALAEMEKAFPTGLAIWGFARGFEGLVVGNGVDVSMAEKWHACAAEAKEGVLLFTIQMPSIDLYIQALGDQYVKAVVQRRHRKNERRRRNNERRHRKNENELSEASRSLGQLDEFSRQVPRYAFAPIPQIETLDDFIEKTG